MEVIESLLATCDSPEGDSFASRKTYAQKLREAADKLGKSVRSIQRHENYKLIRFKDAIASIEGNLQQPLIFLHHFLFNR